MEQNKIFVNISVEEEEIQSLKAQKEKLIELSTKIKNSRDEYINSNLSGKTYDSSVSKNNAFVKTIEQRIEDLTLLIDKLEASCNIYNNCNSNIASSITGGNNES